MATIKRTSPAHRAQTFVNIIIEGALNGIEPRNGRGLDEWMDSARGEPGGLEGVVVEVMDGFGLGVAELVDGLEGEPGAEKALEDALRKGCDILTALRSAYETLLERDIREEVARRFGGWR